jgi:hypothetical protein
MPSMIALGEEGSENMVAKTGDPEKILRGTREIRPSTSMTTGSKHISESIMGVVMTVVSGQDWIHCSTLARPYQGHVLWRR